MSDWQAIPHDPCLNYSLYHHPELVSNLAALNSISLSHSTICWNKSQLEETRHNGVQDLSNIEVVDGHLVFYYNTLMNSDVMLNCRLHVSTSTCYICKNSSNPTSHVDIHFDNSRGEICYNPSTNFNLETSLVFSVVCNGSDSTCLSMCLHLHQNSSAAIQEAEDTKLLFHHTYTRSLLLLHISILMILPETHASLRQLPDVTGYRTHW